MAEKEELPSGGSPDAEQQESEKESLFQFLARNPGAKIIGVRLPEAQGKKDDQG